MNLVDIIGGVLSGGATGLLGGAIQLFANYKTAQLQLELEKQRGENTIAQRRVDNEIMQSEYAGKLKVAVIEGETAKDVAATNAFAQGLLREPERYSSATSLTPWQNWILVVIDAIRGIVRPALTLYLCALTTYVWWQVRALIATEDLDTAAVLDLWRMVVQTILYLTTTCILWWFATRNTQAAPKLGA